MENKEVLYKEIFKVCERYFWDNENPLNVIRNARNFTEGYDAYGLEEEQLKILKYRILSEYQLTATELAELGTLFIKTGKYEFGMLAILLLKKHRPRLNREIFDIITVWYEKYLENWGHCDLLSKKILPVMFELGVITIEDMIPWRSSPSKWSRRGAAIAVASQKGILPNQVLLSFAEAMLRERDTTVQQSIGWLIRKAWEIEPLEVEDFLHKHKKTMPQLIMQYATERMLKDRKKRFRKEVKQLQQPVQQHSRKKPKPKPKPAPPKNTQN